MKILYFTTHIRDEDFVRLKGPKPNPAGQNFHGRLIQALAEEDEVYAYCALPYHLENKSRLIIHEQGKITYSYLNPPAGRFSRALFYPTMLSATANHDHLKSKDAVILYDVLNRSCAKAAIKTGATLGLPTVAILTDEIGNITGVSPSYVRAIHKLARHSFHCIALTEGLVESYDFEDDPHYVQPLVVEDHPVKPVRRPKPYIYYGGALYEKDGIGDLIDAYNALRPDYDLVLAGHGPYANKIEEAAKANPRIAFLGQVKKSEHESLIAGASLCINPRRYNAELDELAVPSKVMEYLCYGHFIASTLSTPIKNAYGEHVNWMEGDILSFLKAHLDENGHFANLSQNSAQKAIVNEFGPVKTGKRIHEFLTGINAKKSD